MSNMCSTYIESHQCHSAGVPSSNTFSFKQPHCHQGLLTHGKPKRKGLRTNICGQDSSVIQSAKERDLSHCFSPRPPFQVKFGDVFPSILNFFLVSWNCRSSHRHKLQISKQLYLNSVKTIMQTTFFQQKRNDSKLKCTQPVIGKIVHHHINLH